MPQAPQQLRFPALLVGEGQDEVRFFTALLKEMRLESTQVEQCGGKTGLRTYLRTLRLRPDFGQVHTLAIVRDADTDATSAFHSVCDALQTQRFAIPPAPGQWAPGAVRVGVWLMPEGRTPGMLEDLCLAAVREDRAMACVEEYLGCLAQRLSASSHHTAKARLHVWLASRPEPDLRLGEAAEKGYWPWEHVAFTALREFLQGMRP